MSEEAPFDLVGAPLADALTRHGFTAFTSVQQAVLDKALADRDLRISSQTGSGKTVAVGLILADMIAAKAHEKQPMTGPACPLVLYLAPTRELATQVRHELSWLLKSVAASVECVIGGTSMGKEIRALQRRPAVIVGTPGRMLDHLERGTISPSAIHTVVIDEADQMLDMGFREELEGILDKTPKERRTHMISATFPREVNALAARYQQNAVHVAGTALGEANADIDHVAHMVHVTERNAALVNVLLMAADERTLVFVRTRADAADLSDHLGQLGFSALALHGDLEQGERTRRLNAFRSDAIDILVATDVAARGLDVPDVGRVIHADPPTDADVYTHRSGRTGRAGNKGISIILVPPRAAMQVRSFFSAARVEAAWRPVPTPEQVRRAADQKLRAALEHELATPQEGAPLRSMAEALLTDRDPVDVVTSLLTRARRAGPCEPMTVTPIAARNPVRPKMERHNGTFVPFRVNFGTAHGADARRLLAMVCRRGGIRGFQVGAIRIGDRQSTFEVASDVAKVFAMAVRRPDPRAPQVRIEALHAAPTPKSKPARKREAIAHAEC